MDPNPTRPSFAHAGTTLTESLPALAKDNTAQAQAQALGEKKANDVKSSERDTESNHHPTLTLNANGTLAGTSTAETISETPPLTTVHDVAVLAGTFVMLVWPWIFFGVIWKLDGIEMNARSAKVVTDHPQATSFFVTLLGNIICLLVNILFSIAIIRFAQEWVANRERVQQQVTVFHVSLLSAFRHQSWPWKVADLKHLFVQQRWLPAALVAACIATFAFVPSSTTSLIGPVQYDKTVDLEGTELDFASSASDCQSWFSANPISNNCDWGTYKGLKYTSCLGENQLVDVLESGRGNILSLLSNNTEGLVFSQLGGKNGLHFLGPIRGVLPMGPNGVPAFDTVQPSLVRERPYNYTLEHQGLISTVNCIYDTQSPVKFASVDSSRLVLQYNGTCPDGTTDFLTPSGVISYVSVNSNNGLTFWACKKPATQAQEAAYLIYLRGRSNYADAIGNITCTASPIQPALLPVTYQSNAGIFSSEYRNDTATSRFAGPQVVEQAVASVGALVLESQNFQSNLLAESVITFGVKSFGLDPYNKSDQYLRLYEAMIQGILDYQVTYTRLIYSTVPDPPSSCIRTVNGTFTYEAVGWEATSENIGFLVPMTLVNLTSITVILLAIFMSKPGTRQHDFDPTDPNSLILARHDLAEAVEQHEWHDNVTYRPRHAIQMLRRSATEVLTPDVEKSAEFSASILP